MLTLHIPASEWYDGEKNLFYYLKSDTSIRLEHSLIAISKWESKTKRAWMNEREDKTLADEIEYIKCMTINNDVDPIAYALITPRMLAAVRAYIADPMTATKIYTEKKEGASRKLALMTSEEIYELMVYYHIPFECQKWHMNRLMMLIRVCQEKEKERHQYAEKARKGGKLSPKQMAARSALNNRRQKGHRR